MYLSLSCIGEDVLTLNALTLDHHPGRNRTFTCFPQLLRGTHLSPVLARCRGSSPRTSALGVRLGLGFTKAGMEPAIGWRSRPPPERAPTPSSAIPRGQGHPGPTAPATALTIHHASVAFPGPAGGHPRLGLGSLLGAVGAGAACREAARTPLSPGGVGTQRPQARRDAGGQRHEPPGGRHLAPTGPRDRGARQGQGIRAGAGGRAPRAPCRTGGPGTELRWLPPHTAQGLQSPRSSQLVGRPGVGGDPAEITPPVNPNPQSRRLNLKQEERMGFSGKQGRLQLNVHRRK